MTLTPSITCSIQDQLKAPAAKESWRRFLIAFEGTILDFNMISLLRLDARGVCNNSSNPAAATASYRHCR